MLINTFAELFRKYRLRSEYETLAEFRDGLAEEGAYYDHTLFSHWQKGTRVPKNRKLLLQVLSVFVKRRAITTLQEANTFLQAAGQGYLSDDEAVQFPFAVSHIVPFQVPRKGMYSTGRQQEISRISEDLKAFHTVLLHGQPGVGKTYLAIEIAHELKDCFPDGVFWYRLDTTSPQRVLSGIAAAYGHEVSAHYSLERISEIVRSLIWNKQALFVFDNVQPDMQFSLLFPNSSKCSVLLTSNRSDLPGIETSRRYHLKPFSEEEALALFSLIIPQDEVTRYEQELKTISSLVGHLPLAIQIVAKQITHKHVRVPDLLKKLKQNQISLSSMVYDEKSLRATLALGFESLSDRQKEVLCSCILFQGNDFPREAILSLHSYSRAQVSGHIDELVQLSFLEQTSMRRYALHPLIKTFLERILNTPLPYTKAIKFYTTFMQQNRKKPLFYKKMDQELDTIIGLLNWCIQEKKITEAYALWQVFREYHWHVGYWKDFRRLAKQLYMVATQKKKYAVVADLCISDMSRMWYYDNDIETAEQYALEGLSLAEEHTIAEAIAPAKERYGKICIILERYEQGVSLLREALSHYQTQNNILHESHACRYLSEAFLMLRQYREAEDYLVRALKLIQQHDNENERTVYESVIHAHLGVLALVQEHYEVARMYGEKGLSSLSGKISSHKRSTYLWLNKLVLGLAYSKLGFSVEASVYLTEGKKDLKNLGIEDSYHQINTYARMIKGLL